MNVDLVKNRCYVDTNVFIYLFDVSSGVKRDKAAEIYRALLGSGQGSISMLVVAEWRNVMIKKYSSVVPAELRLEFLELFDVWSPAVITLSTVLNAEKLTRKYSFSAFDSLHVQAALDQSCRYFLSEDMQHGLVVEGRMEIVNPFLEADS